MHISEINIYPIKSLKGLSLDSALVQKRGLQFDRRWMLTTPDGMFFTQREFPRMATIITEITSDGLRVTSNGTGELSIPFEPDIGERQRVTVWQSVCDAVAYKGVVSEWFSDAIGTRCQLVLMPEGSKRHINQRFDRGEDIVSFADGYPLMVIGEASLTDVNRRLERNSDNVDTGEPHALPMNRFRPNLVVADSDPFAGDELRSGRCGEAIFRSTKPR